MSKSKKNKKDFLKKYFNFYSIILIVLIVWGLFLRLHSLSQEPYWIDEGYTINGILSIEEHNSLILDSGETYRCPIYCKATSYITNILGDNAFSYRLLAAVSGTLLILIVYFTTKKIINKHVALLSTFFITFAHYEIAWSRQVRWYTLFSIFFLLTIYFFYRAYKEKKIKFYILTVLSFLISFYIQPISLLLPLGFGVFWIIQDWQKFKNIKRLLKIIGALLLVGIIIFALDYLSGYKLIYQNLINIKIYNHLSNYLLFYTKEYLLFIILIIILPFLKHKYQEQSKLLYSIIIYFLIPLSFLVFVVNYRYLFQLIPILFILSSLSIITLYEDIKKSENKIIYFIVITVLCLSLGYISFLPKNFYYLESDIPGETWGKRSYYLYTPQPNWNGAYEYIKENLKPDDLIISSEPVFTKIFLNQKGYYLAYNRDNSKNNPVDKDISGKEYYVGATIINNISQIDNLLKTKHGFIVFDSLFANKSSSQDFMNYLFKFKKLKSSYSNERNKISQIVVFKF